MSQQTVQSQQALLEDLRHKEEVLRRNRPPHPINLQRKIQILAKYRQLQSDCYLPSPEASTYQSLANVTVKRETKLATSLLNTNLNNEINLQNQLPDVAKDLEIRLLKKIEQVNKEIDHFEDNDITLSNKMNDQLKAIKEDTKQLTHHLKTVITEYLFVYELALQPGSKAYTKKKELALKLIESLLNNSILGTQWIDIDPNDELVKFLMINGLVIVEENKIKLKNMHTFI